MGLLGFHVPRFFFPRFQLPLLLLLGCLFDRATVRLFLYRDAHRKRVVLMLRRRRHPFLALDLLGENVCVQRFAFRQLRLCRVRRCFLARVARILGRGLVTLLRAFGGVMLGFGFLVVESGLVSVIGFLLLLPRRS